MIHFNEGPRTRGEQFVLRAMMLGEPIARLDWRSLRPKDFAHDTHGQIFRHAQRISASGTRPAGLLVSIDMHKACRSRAIDGLDEYIHWLVLDPCFETGRADAVTAFLDALCEQWEAEAQADARMKMKRSRK